MGVHCLTSAGSLQRPSLSLDISPELYVATAGLRDLLHRWGFCLCSILSGEKNKQQACKGDVLSDQHIMTDGNDRSIYVSAICFHQKQQHLPAQSTLTAKKFRNFFFFLMKSIAAQLEYHRLQAHREQGRKLEEKGLLLRGQCIEFILGLDTGCNKGQDQDQGQNLGTGGLWSLGYDRKRKKNKLIQLCLTYHCYIYTLGYS